MAKPIHLYLVFNPMMNTGEMYPSQAHEFYAALKDKKRDEVGKRSSLFWGKIQLDNSPEFDFEKFNSIIETNKDMGADTHLYITDYHHFWTAKLESVHHGNVATNDTISFYDNKDVKNWFEISDMDLLSAEFQETSFYLSQLYVDNEYQNQKIASLSPYVGGLTFPLVIQDHSEESYFKHSFVEDTLRVNRYNPLIENPKMAGVIKDNVNSFVIPPYVFSTLSQNLREEIIRVETLFAKEKNEESDKTILKSYLKILEILMHETLGNVLKSEYGNCLYVSNDGRKIFDSSLEDTVPLNGYSGNLSIGCYINLLKDINNFGNLSLKKLTEFHSDLVSYFVDELVPFMNEFEIDHLRTTLFQDVKVDIQTVKVMAIRNKILGVGCHGIINSLIMIKQKTHPKILKIDNAA